MKYQLSSFAEKLKTRFRKTKSEGFTLIETLVAITILLMTIVGPLEIASKGLFSAYYARDEIIGYYLAQEGLEFVHNGRDTSYLVDTYTNTGNEDWLIGFDDCLDANGCIVDGSASLYYSYNELNPDAVQDCAGGCPPLRFDTFYGLYQYASGEPTKYVRTIHITDLGDEALVEATVTWTVGLLFSSSKTFTLSERIFNWQRQ